MADQVGSFVSARTPEAKEEKSIPHDDSWFPYATATVQTVIFNNKEIKSRQKTNSCRPDTGNNILPQSCSCPALERRYQHIYCVRFTNFVVDIQPVHLCRNSRSSLCLVPVSTFSVHEQLQDLGIISVP